MKTIIRRLKSEKRGLSNVLVVMLSLILITVIVANVVLWSYQMSQLDIERMHESVRITNASRSTRSKWFTAQHEFSIIKGTNINGSYIDTKAINGFYETFREEAQIIPRYFYPSAYNLLGGTSLISGSLSDLQSNNDVYMTFGSYAEVEENFVDQQSNVDGSIDIGMHSNFDGLKARDNTFDTLTEAATSWIPTYTTITFDSANSVELPSAATSMSWTHTTGTGDNRILLVSIGVFSRAGTPATVTSITYGGTALTLLATDVYTTNPQVRSYLYYLLNPPSGTRTISVQFSASTLAIGGSVTYFGVNQTSPFQASGTSKGAGTTPSISLTATGSYNKVFYASLMSYRISAPSQYTITEGSGQTNRWQGIAYTYKGRGSEKTVTSGSVSMSWTLSRTASFVCLGAILVPALVSVPSDYRLDLEVQWTNVDYTKSNKQLCIYTGALDSEILRVDVWTGSSWAPLINALSVGWNNVSVSDYLTSNTFTVRFKDEIPDETRSSWQIDCALILLREDQIQIEFTGNLDAQNCTELIWTIDCSSTIGSVNVTFQLFDYEAGDFSVSGDGCITATVGMEDITLSQTIRANITRFIDVNGDWKMRITGKAASLFNLKIDLIELKAASPSNYRLELQNLFKLDLSAYPLDYIYGLEIMVRYTVSEAAERWFIKAYDWSAESFSDEGFNVTMGNQPIANKWNNYTISINLNWTRYVRGDGAVQIVLYDEGVGESQTFLYVDFVGVRIILNGIRLDMKNSGATTAHIVSIWIINATHHTRYDADFFINPGESTTYIRIDIAPPAGDFIIKVVTERGNVNTF